MATRTCEMPAFLKGQCKPAVYQRWLRRKAAAHVRRDRARGNRFARVSAYRMAIHMAVVQSAGRDAYTGRPMAWKLLSRYNNEASRAGQRTYKRKFGDLPTVDHVGDGRGKPVFHICSWRTNDAKNDLIYDDFVNLCREVLKHERQYRARAR